MVHDKQRLKELQALPLERKIMITQVRIIEWYNHYKGQVYISFSGGKDSTVLLDIARKCFPDIEAVFVNTGLEYPEIQQFVKSFDNVTILRPKMRFDEAIKKHGYPLISKQVSKTVSAARRLDSKYGVVCRGRLEGIELLDSGKKSLYNCPKYKPLLDVDFEVSNRCCDVMKKNPAHDYTKKSGKTPITATMADESMLREKVWLRNGCNAFDSKNPVSNPMSFWTEQDVLQYIKRYNLPIASVYGEIVYETEKLTTTGCKRTGCIFCAFGCHLEKEPSRFQMLKETHPRQYEYCIGGGEFNENGIWQPSKEGLGMGYVFDELNKIYGENFIKYK
jgi:3'-phosphoadenosine 5'-phosphosulfate sulfotransferase (PAPS reductase)/FAD synthetase